MIELNHITFWENIDIIGVEASFMLTTKEAPTVMEILTGLKKNTGRIFYTLPTTTKPIIFTKIGFRSINGTNINSSFWNDTTDLQEQSDCYEATMLSLLTDPRISGLFWWNWSLKPDTKKIGYTPEGKPAEKVMTDWFRGTATNSIRGTDIWIAENIQKKRESFLLLSEMIPALRRSNALLLMFHLRLILSLKQTGI